MTNGLKTGIVRVGELLQYPNLTIPPYQRPYKWTTRNVLELLDDVLVQHHQKRTSYRLGTLVIHEEDNQLNIVDGQQRTITLILVATAILEHKSHEFKNPELVRLTQELQSRLIQPRFSNEISIENIQQNYREIERVVAAMDEESIRFLLTKCEFIQFVLTDISEAFQFFDSQNARGKDLEPHDLLKAFHLREFTAADAPHQAEIVDAWESMDTQELAGLFGEYLFRIRGWSKGNSSRYFFKEHVGLFKGINIDKIDNYPFARMYRIAHFFVDGYNGSFERKIDYQKSEFPFQLDQTIINGRRFFEMISYYKRVFNKYKAAIADDRMLDEKAKLIFLTIDNYEGMHRIGDQYIRNLFDCAIMFYLDKFGSQELSRVIERVFIWAYTLRLRHQAVYLASVDNYVVGESNLFRLIKESITPQEILMLYLNPIKAHDVKSTKTESIIKLFETLRYYER